MISLDQMKLSEVGIAGDRSNCMSIMSFFFLTQPSITKISCRTTNTCWNYLSSAQLFR